MRLDALSASISILAATSSPSAVYIAFRSSSR